MDWDFLSQIWAPIVFGWPFIILGLALGCVGALRRSPLYLLVASLVAAPSAWYLSNYPCLRPLALGIPIFYLGAALATRGRSKWVPWLLLVPPTLAYGGLALMVISG